MKNTNQMEYTKWVIANNMKIEGQTINKGIINLPKGAPPYLIAIVHDDNAYNLIAAAPQMYEALKEIIDAQYNPDKSLANLNGTIGNAKVLIKQIEG